MQTLPSGHRNSLSCRRETTSALTAGPTLVMWLYFPQRPQVVAAMLFPQFVSVPWEKRPWP